eukprot:3767416-Pleurochrysis_carterae.AAC.1
MQRRRVRDGRFHLVSILRNRGLGKLLKVHRLFYSVAGYPASLSSRSELVEQPARIGRTFAHFRQHFSRSVHALGFASSAMRDCAISRRRYVDFTAENESTRLLHLRCSCPKPEF